MECLVCGIKIENKAKTCSPKCRKILSRQQSVTKDVSVTQPIEESVTFEFTVVGGKGSPDDVKQAKSKVRTAKYWYDVPIAGVPKVKKDWPKMPDFMNGRQYFLWWKNDFKIQEDGTPIIHNPFPAQDKVEYISAGEGSRRWGTV